MVKKLGGEVEIAELPTPEDMTVGLPPVLLGKLGTDPNKKTLLVYGHLDVQPAEKVVCMDLIDI